MELRQLINETNKEYYDSCSYYKSIQSKAKQLLDYFGATKNIKKIDYKAILGFKSYLKQQGNSKATINGKLTYLRTLLKFAYKSGVLDKLPVFDFETITEHKTSYIETSTFLEVLRYCKKNNLSELRQVLLVAYFTGARINNVLSITQRNIDRGYVRFWENKTHKPYSVPISYKLKPILNENFKGFSLNYQQVYYLFNQIKCELNLDVELTLHSFRHSFCTRLVRKGVDLPIIQALANHKKITSTMIYAHLANEQLEKAIKVL